MDGRGYPQFVSAVVCVRDADAGAAAFCGSLARAMGGLFERWEAVLVDDGCRDGSAAAAARALAEGGAASAEVVSLGRAHGAERAQRAGLDASVGDFVFLFARAAGEASAEDLERAFVACLAGSDVVFADPQGAPPLSSRLFYAVFNRYSGGAGRIGSDAFALATRRAVNRVGQLDRDTPLLKAALASCGLGVARVPSGLPASPSAGALSKGRRELAFDALLYYTDLGYRAARGLSLAMAAVSVLSFAYACVVFAVGRPVAGWTSTMLVLSLSFTGLFVVLALAMKHLSLMLSLETGRRGYALRDVRKITEEDLR